MVTSSNSDLCSHFDFCSLFPSGHCQRQWTLSYFVSSTHRRKISCFFINPYPFTGLLELVLLAPSVFLLAFFMACTGSGEGLFPLTSFGDSARRRRRRRSLCYLFGKYLKGLEAHPMSARTSCALHTHKQIWTSSQEAEIHLKHFCQSIEVTAREGRKPPSFPCQLFNIVWKVNQGRRWRMLSSRWSFQPPNSPPNIPKCFPCQSTSASILL